MHTAHLTYRRAGEGPAVLLLHAGVADAHMWDRQLDDLARDYDLLAPDLRGYGQTPLTAGDTYSDATDVLSLLEQLSLESVAAVGASYGAHVLLQAATQQPWRFERLVLLCPFVETVEPTEDIQRFWEQEERLLQADALDAAASLNVSTWLGPEADDQTWDVVWGMQRHAFALQSAADEVEDTELGIDLEAISAPVHVFSGAHDLDFFAQGAVELTAACDRVEHTVLPWAGHLPTLERPEDGTSLIRGALGAPPQ